MKMDGKFIYVIPSCQIIRLESREAITLSSPMKVILTTEIEGSFEPASIGIESLGYEDL